MNKTDKYKIFERNYLIYEELERKQVGHISNPCDPLKKLYKESLSNIRKYYDHDFDILYQDKKDFLQIFKHLTK